MYPATIPLCTLILADMNKRELKSEPNADVLKLMCAPYYAMSAFLHVPVHAHTTVAHTNAQVCMSRRALTGTHHVSN